MCTFRLITRFNNHPKLRLHHILSIYLAPTGRQVSAALRSAAGKALSDADDVEESKRTRRSGSAGSGSAERAKPSSEGDEKEGRRLTGIQQPPAAWHSGSGVNRPRTRVQLPGLGSCGFGCICTLEPLLSKRNDKQPPG